MGRRALLYSHDTFGLGHIRRSRTIAQALVQDDPSLAALILTGSPIAGRFDFPYRVDHVRLPGIVKLSNGDYASHNLGLPIEETVALRAAIIEAAAGTFQPDLMIVDKEAWGFRNELAATLEAAHRAGTRLVLGIRDVLDDPDMLADEWARKGHAEAVERYFDEIWIYGLPEICRPLDGLGLPAEVMHRVHYTGYLRREAPEPQPDVEEQQSRPFILVTTGGGGDGAPLIDWVLSAYESDPSLEPHAVLVYGPFMPAEASAAFDARVEALGGRVSAMRFASRMEKLLVEAEGIIAMGGYNTFCEILSVDRPAVIVPRTRPRREQLIRAAAAEKLGLIRMLSAERDGVDPAVMGRAIRDLPRQARPSAVRVPGLLDGLDRIVERTACGRQLRAVRR
jgi:predicted glycosyltransferase